LNGRKARQRVVLEAVQNPRSVATDYLLKRLGLNFRAGTPKLEEDGSWYVPLVALIPSSPGVVPRKEDQLFYRFDSFGEIALDPRLKVISAPTSTDLNRAFQVELGHLYMKIEKMILEFGTDKWGRIPLVRSFLNPLNAIVSEALSLPNISLSKLEQQDYMFYAELLRRCGFLEPAEKADYLRRTNDLVTIAEKFKKEKGPLFYMDETAIEVTSIICSKFYPDIKERVTVLPSYVGATVAYYAKAVRLRKLVHMTVRELEYAYNVLGRREQDARTTFYGKVADLVTAGFLQWVSQGVVSGVMPIYSRIEQFEPEMERTVHLLRADAESRN
jgi:hypothetical protein